MAAREKIKIEDLGKIKNGKAKRMKITLKRGKKNGGKLHIKGGGTEGNYIKNGGKGLKVKIS